MSLANKIVSINQKTSLVKKGEDAGIVLELKPDSKMVKGILSAESEDRQEETTDSSAFDIPSFMAKPVLCVNHELWRDEYGNKVSAGKPTKIIPAILQNHPTDNSLYNVMDLDNKTVLNTYAKEKAPNLKAGDKIVWFEAVVSRDDVYDLVQKGELNGLSWKGLTRYLFKQNPKTGKMLKHHTNVDLIDVTLCNRPMHGSATCMAMKSLDGSTQEFPSELNVLAYLFDKKNYNRDTINSYLENNKLNKGIFIEDDSVIYSVQGDVDKLDVTDTAITPLRDVGISVLVGKPEIESELQYDGVTNLDAVNRIKSLMGLANKTEKNKMSEPIVTNKEAVVMPVVEKVDDAISNVAVATKEVDDNTVASTANADSVKPAENNAANDESQALEAITNALSTKVNEMFSPVFETLSNTLKDFGLVLTTLTTNIANLIASTRDFMAVTQKALDGVENTQSNTPTVVSKPTPTSIGQNNLQQSVMDLRNQMDNATKVLEAVSKSIPDTSKKTNTDNTTINNDVTNNTGQPNNKMDILSKINVFKGLGVVPQRAN